MTSENAALYDAPLDSKPKPTQITLDLKDIKDLIALMRKNELSVFKMEHEGFKITLKRENDYQPHMTGHAPASMTMPAHSPHGETQPLPAPASTPAAADPSKDITSPMVGTFYSAPSPESPPYLSVGQEVAEDTVICIIEAMKVMNEVKAERRGIVAEIVAEDGRPVQFGQVLYRLK